MKTQHLVESTNERQLEATALPGMSLRAFMKQTTAYEALPAPFSPLLRQATWTGIILTVSGLIVVALLRVSGIHGNEPFFVIMPGQLHALLGWMIQNPIVSYIQGVLLGSGIVLLIMTRNLRQGNPAQHWLAFIQAIGGTANLLMLTLPALVTLINVVFWIVVTILAILALILILRILALFA